MEVFIRDVKRIVLNVIVLNVIIREVHARIVQNVSIMSSKVVVIVSKKIEASKVRGNIKENIKP